MNRSFVVCAETTYLSVFDDVALRSRLDDESDWWTESPETLPEVLNGVIALADLGRDGVYQARLTDGPLTSDERDYAVSVARFGLVARSGTVFVAAAEHLPGGGLAPEPDPDEGCHAELVAPGAYEVEIYGVRWTDSPQWWDEHGPWSQDGPPDLVIRLVPRGFERPIVAPAPLFEVDPGVYLFESRNRRVGPNPGMRLRTRVARGPSGKRLDPCGPAEFQPILDPAILDDLPVGKTLFVEVLEVDRDARTAVVQPANVREPGRLRIGPAR